MPVANRRAARLCGAVVLAATAIASGGQAAGLPTRPLADGTVLAQFDPITQSTRIAGHVTQGLCFSFRLPRQWRATSVSREIKLEAASFGAELDLNLRSAHDLQGMPQPDLAGRDAAILQRDYESLLGRPAQSVILASSASGASRWSATWIDANLPAPSRSLTIETFIVPLSREWVLELSFSNVEAREAHDDLTQTLLKDLMVQGGAACEG